MHDYRLILTRRSSFQSLVFLECHVIMLLPTEEAKNSRGRLLARTFGSSSIEVALLTLAFLTFAVYLVNLLQVNAGAIIIMTFEVIL